jgi:NTP pyrophosphatase (non-canonical NTP hydrolase)
MSYPGFSLDNYQSLAARTLIIDEQPVYTDIELALIWNALGLAGESGEVVDLIKKQVCHKHGIDRDVIAKELGDVLWYVAAIATKLDLKLSDIADLNIDKLKARYPEGFSFDRSLNRSDD